MWFDIKTIPTPVPKDQLSAPLCFLLLFSVAERHYPRLNFKVIFFGESFLNTLSKVMPHNCPTFRALSKLFISFLIFFTSGIVNYSHMCKSLMSLSLHEKRPMETGIFCDFYCCDLRTHNRALLIRGPQKRVTRRNCKWNLYYRVSKNIIICLRLHESWLIDISIILDIIIVHYIL